jgi:squalene-associated FAD-dependent desaturase
MVSRPTAKVAIIGGGYAGMAAAVKLSEQGISVTVFESAKQLGGRARGVCYQNTQLDNGQHLLLGCYRQTLQLIEQVGGNLETDFLRLPLQLELHRQFSLRAPRLPAPLHLLIGLLGATGISFASRLKAARFMWTMRQQYFQLKQDVSVAELMVRYRQPTELIEKLWEPLCIAALNTPLQKASAQVMLNVLRDALNQSRAASDMLLPRMDFTALFPQRAAHFVEQRGGKVAFSAGVEQLVVSGNQIEVRGQFGTERFDQVVCATLPTVAAKLLSNLPEMVGVVRQIEALTQQPIYTVYLQYPVTVKLPHAMLGLHRCFSQWLFDKGHIAGQLGLIAAVISAEGAHQEFSTDELVQKVSAELKAEFGISESPLWHKVIAEKRATFSCAPNLDRPSQQTPFANLVLAGDYTAGDYPATLEGAVLSGVRCAELLLARLNFSAKS